MRRIANVVAAVALLALPGSARAVIGTIDHVPAATLLLPYFEVDPAGTASRGVTTVFSVTNSNFAAVLFHVTVWTDAAVPVTFFNFYLTGYDTVTMDLRDLLAGTIPATATAGQDPMDTVSPQGEFSQDINYASCNGHLPRPPAEASAVAKWRAALSGKPDPETSLCSGFDHGDNILRGYLTVDTVNSCVEQLPSQPGYFDYVTLQNFLFGTWLLMDKPANRLHAAPLVAIEANLTNPETSVPGNYTFYGRYVNWNATDHREPLATNFAARYVVSGGTGAPNSTALIVWRDPKVNAEPFACGATPVWFPLGQEGVFFFDEQEQPQILAGNTQPFARATQKVVVDSAALPTNFSSGWLYLSLNTAVAAAAVYPPEDPAAAQGWVEVLHSDDDPTTYGARGHLGFALPPAQLDSATTARHVLTP